MKVISSAENKYVKLASSLKYRKYRDERHMFIVEGQRAVMEAGARPDLIEVAFLDTNLLERQPAYADMKLPNSYLLEPKLVKQVCSTDNPQGIAVVMNKPVWAWDEVVDQRGRLLLLDRIGDPGNLGSILRTSWAFGVKGVLMTKGCVDLYAPKVVRSSMGAILNVPVFPEITDGQLEMLQRKRYQYICTDIQQGEKYYAVQYEKPTVIILGSEGQGVSLRIQKYGNRIINIPMQPGVDSLNVASACAIILAEAWRQEQETAQFT